MSELPTAPVPAPPETGVAEVDATLADLADAFALPVADQVRAVEHGHDRLRRALDEPGPEPA